MNSRFESKGAVFGETEIATSASSASSSSPASAAVHQPPADNRTLYERLAANRLQKEEEFVEKTRLANLIKKLDPDEIDFLQSQRDAKRKMQQELDKQVRDELDVFRKATSHQQLPSSFSVTDQDEQQQQQQQQSSKTAIVAGFSLSLSAKTKKKPAAAASQAPVVVATPSTSSGQEKASPDTQNKANAASSAATAANRKKKPPESSREAPQPPKPALSAIGALSGYASSGEDED
ncbi:hypothetical protein HDU84_002094 [Entophlyctis sp. JEL0112]|nr:hypothetical protein HDU84_002094 [Entophlyctis sp. JEL0112]